MQHVGSLVVARELLVAACMWELVPRPRPPALGAWSLNHCATRGVPLIISLVEISKFSGITRLKEEALGSLMCCEIKVQNVFICLYAH